MTTSSGHTSAILASKVKGTAVYTANGEKIGHIEDVVLDKLSDRVMFAALGSGGVLGMGEKYRPVPWSVLDYSEEKHGYVVPLSSDQIRQAPAYELKELARDDGTAAGMHNQVYTYYKVPIPH